MWDKLFTAIWIKTYENNEYPLVGDTTEQKVTFISILSTHATCAGTYIDQPRELQRLDRKLR